MSINTKAYLLIKRPRGELSADCFKMDDRELSELKEGEVLLRATHFSVDPYMRNKMNDVKSYTEPYTLNAPLTGDAIAEVVQSNSEKYSPGDLITGNLPWQEFCVRDTRGLLKIDENLGPATSYLGILGLTGLTAYFGILDIGNPKKGESVVISGAAGAVGLIAGQIAKIKGCHVTGIAGSEEKIKYLTEKAGFDRVLNYKEMPNIRRQLRKMLPGGVDIYFDNVGGEISDSIMYILRDHARIIMCGQIALYNASRIETGPRLLAQLIIHRVKMQGFIVYDYFSKFDQARQELAGWLRLGKLKQPENIIKGFEFLPDALMGLFRGDNLGKQIVEV